MNHYRYREAHVIEAIVEFTATDDAAARIALRDHVKAEAERLMQDAEVRVKQVLQKLGSSENMLSRPQTITTGKCGRCKKEIDPQGNCDCTREFSDQQSG